MSSGARLRLIIGLRLAHHQTQGLSLIELLVTIIVLAVLSAMIIPAMLTQVNRAKESEAKSYVGTINRAQQAYYIQNHTFGSLGHLELGISPDTHNYVYTSLPAGSSTFSTAITTATPMSPTSGVRGYAGRAWIGSTGGEVSILTIVCEGDLGEVPTIVEEGCP